MLTGIAIRLVRQTEFRLLFKFAYNLGWKSFGALRRFKRRNRAGINFPAFLFISVTNRCNLRCQGCWVRPTNPPADMDPIVLNNLVSAAKKQGINFFGILGGEPLLHAGIFDLFGKHPDCYFVLFTNGTLITPEIAERLNKLGNVSPLISIEGLADVSDVRRGGKDVYTRTLDGLQLCRDKRLITGVATSVCKSNIKDLLTGKFVDDVAARGAQYLWYYIYRPVGPQPAPELALSRDEIAAVRRFIVDIRTKAPIIIIDAYWDQDGNALCPAASGLAYHISPQGFIEPCPPMQVAAESIGDGTRVYDTIVNSKFLRDFRREIPKKTCGCILLDDPAFVGELMTRHSAADSSGRNAIRNELAAMTPKPSHDMGADRIPEKVWFYRFAKKHAFFGLGAYG